MSTYQKVLSIFNWVTRNIKYGHLKLFRNSYIGLAYIWIANIKWFLIGLKAYIRDLKIRDL